MTDTTVDPKMTIDSTPALISNGQSLATDNEGYLENLTDWNEDVAELIAKNEGLELTENRWQIIHLLRRFL
jgi:tRNA 2-thiouridine synthesizing protein E